MFQVLDVLFEGFSVACASFMEAQFFSALNFQHLIIKTLDSELDPDPYLDPDPDQQSGKMLDPDPHYINADPQP